MTTPADTLAEALAEVGSTVAFGVPGGGPNLDVVGAMNRVGVRFVLAHSETAACIMASAHGWLTGIPSAVVVTRGPGAAAAMNGAAQATLDRQPLVLVTDTVPAARRAAVPHQRLDQPAMFAPVTKHSAVLGPSTETKELVALLGQSVAWPPGCVHLDYDATALAPPSPISGPSSTVVVENPREIDGEVMARAAALISGAERPVVIIGVEAVPHAAAVRDAVTALGAPVLTTYQSVGAVPTDAPINAGLFTNGASERPILEQADVIVMLGVDMVEPIPAAWHYDAPVISINSVAVTDDYLPIAHPLVGDVGSLTEQVLGGASHRWAPDAGSAHRHGVLSAMREAERPADFGPVSLVESVIEHGETPIVTVDAGAHFLAIMPMWPVRQPKQLLISNGLATMGYAVPAAIGAALARPGEPVTALTGDGGLGMCLAELETIARLELPITVVVFNDAALSLIEIKQGPEHGGSGAVRYRPSDFAAIARGMGMAATRVESAEALRRGLAASEGGPHLIDAVIDPSAYPELIRITRG